MSQTADILARLVAGERVTPADAYERHGCLALHSRIAEIRDMGYGVRCRIVTASGRRWGEYSLDTATAEIDALYREAIFA